MPTIYDVAKEAGCSPATVSRALADDIRISEATRARVREAARRLRYRSNPIARALSQGRSRTIGLVIPKLDTQVFSAGASLLHDLLSKAGYRILLSCHSDNEDADVDALRSLIEYHVDGIIHVPSTAGGSQNAIDIEHSIPIIELLRRSDSAGVDAVVADRELGSFELTRHLIELGHTKITLLCRVDRRRTTETMQAGFSRALRDFRINRSCSEVRELTEHEAVDLALDALFTSSSAPTAVIATNTELSYALLRAVRRHDISVPQDLSIAGFLNADWCAISNPSLTAYEIPLHEIGLLAAQMMLNRLEPKVERSLSHSVVRCAGRLEVRESTGIPRPVGAVERSEDNQGRHTSRTMG